MGAGEAGHGRNMLRERQMAQCLLFCWITRCEAREAATASGIGGRLPPSPTRRSWPNVTPTSTI